MAPIVVADYRPEDQAAVAEIATATQSQFDIGDELQRNHARVWVARASVEPCSVLGFLLVWLVADEVHILHLATHPARRRKGAGKALLEHLVAEARDNKARLVLLEVRRSNEAALALYRSQGYSAIGTRLSYYRDTGEDAIQMMLRLDDETQAGRNRADSERSTPGVDP